MAQKIIVKNKRTHELLELTLPEFKEKFKAELKTALDSFEKQESRKIFLPAFCKPNNNFESDFYFSLCVGISIICKIQTGTSNASFN